jgi:hypothetical protein
METTSLLDLLVLLRGSTLTVRTGLWLVPSTFFGQEQDEAARLGIDAVDVRLPILARLPAGTRFLGLTEASVLEALDVICQQKDGGDCVLVYNLDLLLAKLPRQDRVEFWHYLYRGFPHRSRGLLIVMPSQATHLLPAGQSLTDWGRDQRLVTYPQPNGRIYVDDR